MLRIAFFGGFCLLSLTLQPRTSVRAKISALGIYLPPRLLTNADLERMVETSDRWITERTGIRERHVVDKGVATSDLAAKAARNCLKNAGVDAGARRHHRGNGNARYGLSGHRVPGAGQDWGHQGVGI